MTEIINLSPFYYEGYNEPLERVKELWSFKRHPTTDTIWEKVEEIFRIIKEVYPGKTQFLISGHPFMVVPVAIELIKLDLEPIFPYMFKGQLTGIIRPYQYGE